MARLAAERGGKVDFGFDHHIKLAAYLQRTLHDELAGGLCLLIAPPLVSPLQVFDELLRRDAIGAHVHRKNIHRIYRERGRTIRVENGDRAAASCSQKGLRWPRDELNLHVLSKSLAKAVGQIGIDGDAVGRSAAGRGSNPDGVVEDLE